MCVYTLKMILNKSKMIIIIVFLCLVRCRKSGTNDLFNTTIPLFKKKETQKVLLNISYITEKCLQTTCQQTSAEARLHCSQSALSLLIANFSLPNFSR